MPIDPNEIIVILDDPDFQALFPSDNRNFAAFAALILAHARARIGEANILQRLASLEAAATTARDKINTLSYLQMQGVAPANGRLGDAEAEAAIHGLLLDGDGFFKKSWDAARDLLDAVRANRIRNVYHISQLPTAREYAAALENERGQHNITKDKVKEFERYADNAQAKVDALTTDAAQYLRGLEFYRGIVVQIGDMFGVAARTSDDGSVQQDVLALKVPELVAALKQEVALANGRLEQAATGWQERENALVSAAERNAEKAQAWETVVDCLHKNNLSLYPQPEATGMAAACGIIDRLVAERERANDAQAGVEGLTHDLQSCMTQRDTAIARAEKLARLLREVRDSHLSSLSSDGNNWLKNQIKIDMKNRIDAALAEGGK